MEEEKTEAIKNWLELPSVKDIQVFLSFANFYRKFIKNFSRIATSLTSMLQTTDNNDLGAQASGYKEDQDITANATNADGDGSSGRSIKNLSAAAKLAKSKKPNFAKANSKTDFLTPGAKEAFIYL